MNTGAYDEILKLALVIVHNAQYGAIRSVVKIVPLLADAEMGLHCLPERYRLRILHHEAKEEAPTYCIDVDGILPFDDRLQIFGTKLSSTPP